MFNRYQWRGLFWIVLYGLLVTGPLLVLLLGPTPPGRGFWTEFSVALGFAGLAMMGLQFGLVARFRAITSPFGIDIIYHFHRQISWVMFGLILAHPVILFITDPTTRALLNPITAPWRARFGWAGLIALVLVIALSIWRKPLRINYEAWRLSHGLLATIAVIGAMAHILLVNHHIATPWKRAMWVTLAVVWIGLLVYIRLIRPLWLLRRPYRVAEVRELPADSLALVLEPDGHAGFRFQPGQFMWLTVWGTPFNVTENPFSMASSAERPERIEFAIKAVGDFTERLSDVTPGKRVYVDGPYGAFSVDREPADQFVFITGGVGITPIMSFLNTLADRGDTRPIVLLYGNPTWDSIIYRDEIEALKDRLRLTVVHVLEEPDDDWEGETGFINEEIIRKYVKGDLNQHEYYIVGPDPMMDAVEETLEKMNIPLYRYHTERYSFI